MTLSVQLLLLPLVFSGLTYGQSLIGRMPYRVDSAKSKPPLLNPVYTWNQLPPLPQVDIPEQLPFELTMPAEDFAEWNRLREANLAVAGGKPEKALPIYTAYLEAHPDVIQIRIALADALFALDRYEEAETLYLNALEQDPLHFQALNNLAWMYCAIDAESIHKPERALELATRASLILQNSHHVWSTLSQVYYALDQYEEARNAARNALQLVRQTRTPPRIVVNYLIQLEKCQMALEATSILE